MGLKRVDRLLFPAIILLTVLLGLVSTTDGHQWEGDSFGYLMQARALVDNDVASVVAANTFTIAESSYSIGPTVYPWGYPVLLAPVLRYFGLELLALKSISVVFFILFLICLFVLLRHRITGTGALVIVSLFALNPLFVSFHDLVLSDIPFLFLSTLAILLIDHSGSRGKTLGHSIALHLALGVVIFAAFFTRTNGILLLPVLLTAQLSHGRCAGSNGSNPRVVRLVPYLTFLVLAGLSSWQLPAGGASHLSDLGRVSLTTLSYNAVYYAALPSAFFESLPLDRPLYVLTLPLVLLGIWSSDRRDYPFITYCVLTYLLYVMWPVRQGIRFIFPILPFYLYFMYTGARYCLTRLRNRHRLRGMAVAIGAPALTLTVFLSLSLRGALSNLENGRTIEGPFDNESTEMFDFVAASTEESDVVVFFRPRIMAFNTDNRSILINDCGQLSKGDYYVFHVQLDRHNQIPLDSLYRCQETVNTESVFSNERFKVFKIREADSASGEVERR